jgi:exopolyphosphatase/guanosine-5'-triphosphate,3'-diphosphate pyrophosphatase
MAHEVAASPPPPNNAAQAAPKPPFHRRNGNRHTYGAIDLGTNNCRLLIARPTGEGFTVVDAFSRIVRLGEGLSTSGRLSQDAMDRAVGALAVCAD